MTVYVTDTHTLLWYLFTPQKLSETGRYKIVNIQANGFVHTYYESTGKLSAN
jgi:PIN domain nuclease of toxin-antitoxin system